MAAAIATSSCCDAFVSEAAMILAQPAADRRLDAPGVGARPRRAARSAMLCALATAPLAAALLAAALLAPASASAVGQCGNQKDTCKCGKNNPYPCCDNGSNCTWWSWHEACCTWGYGLPGWGNANTWSMYAKQHPDFQVLGHPVVNSIATSTQGKYGHVAWVIAVGGSTVTVREMNCCGTCPYGMITRTHKTAYFNSGFVVPKPKGPVCGANGCEGGENCANCPQDCGNCCGNGACDHGENCASCTKDCHCAPKGAFEHLSCSAGGGWAVDDNVPGKALTVRLHSGDKEIGSVSAGAPHPGHGNHGFSWKVPTSLHDGAHHDVQARADDGNSGGPATLGSRGLRCRQGVVAHGPWRTSYDACGGFDAAPRGWGSDLDGKGTASRLAGVEHRRGASDPYALSGALRSCLRPGAQPFAQAVVDVASAWAGAPLQIDLRVDDGLATTVGVDKAPQSLLIDRSGSELCLRSAATAEPTPQAGGATKALAVRFLTAGFWHGVEPIGHGMRLDLGDSDALALVSAPASEVPAKVALRGAVRVWRTLGEPFDAIQGMAQAADTRAQAHLLVHGEDDGGVELVGAFEHARLSPRTTLALRLSRDSAAGEAGAAPDATLIAVRRLRLRRNDTAVHGAFDVEHIGSFGLRVWTRAEAAAAGALNAPAGGFDGGAANPHAAQGLAPPILSAQGRAIVLGSADSGWWSTGTVRAGLRERGPAIERVRLQLRGDVSVGGLTLRALALDAAGVPLAAAGGATQSVGVELPAAGPAEVEIAMPAARLGLELRRNIDAPQATPAAVAIERISLCHGGWWTSAGEHTVGLDHDRTSRGGLVLRAHHQDGAPQGARTLRRELTKPMRALRFRLTHQLPAQGLKLAVLLDGVAAALLHDAVPGEKVWTVQPPSKAQGQPAPAFSTITFALWRDGGALPGGTWQAMIEDLALQGVGGAWTPLEQVPWRQDPALTPEALPAAAAMADAGATGAAADDGGQLPGAATATAAAPGAAAGGCSGAAGAGNRGVAGATGWLVLALLLVWRRRRGPAQDLWHGAPTSASVGGGEIEPGSR